MRNLLLSTVTLLVVPAVGLAAPDFSSHTHTTPIELKPISSSSGLKLASVCFLGYGDCGDGGFGSIDGDDGYIVDTIKQCQNEGYSVTACSLPSYTSGQCPYNDKYFAKCVEDRPRACNETGFTQTQCFSGMVVDTTCSYDANYKKCKCNPCSGYTYTYAQATAQGYVADGSCLSCSETKYKRKENPCSGYTTCECGGEVGSSVCYTGSTQKFKSCKKCCDDTCPSGTGKNYTGSAAGRTECGNTCYNCNKTCPSGSSTSYSGTIVGYNECGQACRKCSEDCPSGMSTTHPGGCPSSQRNECGTKTCYGGYEQCYCTQFVTGGSCSTGDDCFPGWDSPCHTWSCTDDHTSLGIYNDGNYRCEYQCSYPC